MKAPFLLSAALLVGASTAEVHKLKLNKVPLEEQLVSSYLTSYTLEHFQSISSL